MEKTGKIPVTIPYFTDDEYEAVKKVLASGWVAQGPKVAEFEKAIAAHEGVKAAVATTSCTTALHLAMAACGVKRGMDVIVPAFTFVATANAVVMCSAEPVFCDIMQETFNISISCLKKLIGENYELKEGAEAEALGAELLPGRSCVLVNRRNGNLLWGIVPVHEFGLCCDIYAVNEIAGRYQLSVIEDAACALGSKIGDRHEGAFGNISCVSFHPRKSITTGEGGMILCPDEGQAERMRQLRTHGSTVSADARDKSRGFLLPEFNEAGYNYRMTDIQAAVGCAQIGKLDQIIDLKRKNAGRYDRLLESLPELISPCEPEGYFHSYQSYVCMLDLKKTGCADVEEGGLLRNLLLQRLEDLGVATRQGTHAVHMLGYYRDKYGYRPEDYPNAWACDHLSITLPNYAQMTEEDQDRVVRELKGQLSELLSSRKSR